MNNKVALLKQNIYFAIGMIFSFSVLFHFYNHYWYPPDDGAYAHVADRILSGEILNLDIHDVHFGYINFLNAAAFSLFGNEMVSMRIPIVIMGLIQAALIFWLLTPRGPIVALCGVLALSSLSFIQYLNPTANWYGLFLTILTIVAFQKIPENYKYKFLVIGYILITLFLFRQLSGVITSMGAVCYILYSKAENISLKSAVLSKLLFAVMILGLCGYLFMKVPASAIILFGLWPVVLLINGLFRVSVDNKMLLKILIHMLVGGILAAAPLLLYHLYHGSIGSWYNDTVISALSLTELNFIQKRSFLDFLIFSLVSITKLPSFEVLLNNLYWIFLILVTPVLGIVSFLKICGRNQDKRALSALPMIAVFYALVTVHYQIFIYLYYTVGLSLCALFWMIGSGNVIKRSSMLFLILYICTIALYFHAGQSSNRFIPQILRGERTVEKEVFFEGNVGLWLRENEATTYHHIIDLVDKHVGQNETIFAFPSNAEIYYITGRKNPFRFFNSSFGIHTEKQFDDVMATLKTNAPRMVFYTPDDKYNTENSLKIYQYIKSRYDLLETVAGMEYYLLRD
ncbi:MAG: hypothetical protein H6912_02050 [Kordiimonadaceae bacterium]|nr:hypothetical protein [Kordiimonadaceae bacterium]